MLYAVGVIEIKSIAKGVEACDDALKSAEIRLVSAHSSCPGKYEMILTGALSSVQMALEHVREKFEPYIIDTVLLGRIDKTVVDALMGVQEASPAGALGVVETYSAASAIRAADAAVKTAKVEILDLRVSRGMGGKGVVMLTGEVSDVTAAVESGADYARSQGLFAASSVMASPHSDLWQYV
mgnify:FL=1